MFSNLVNKLQQVESFLEIELVCICVVVANIELQWPTDRVNDTIKSLSGHYKSLASIDARMSIGLMYGIIRSNSMREEISIMKAADNSDWGNDK